MNERHARANEERGREFVSKFYRQSVDSLTGNYETPFRLRSTVLFPFASCCHSPPPSAPVLQTLDRPFSAYLTLPLSREGNPLRCSAHETSIQLCNLVGYANVSELPYRDNYAKQTSEKFYSESTRYKTGCLVVAVESRTVFPIDLFHFYRPKDLQRLQIATQAFSS